jgi:hypothetical protein
MSFLPFRPCEILLQLQGWFRRPGLVAGPPGVLNAEPAENAPQNIP